jgi:flagellar basal body-associated protein FliL
MKTFIILFVLALLFVIGSAGAMRYLGDKSMPKQDKKDAKVKQD